MSIRKIDTMATALEKLRVIMVEAAKKENWVSKPRESSNWPWYRVGKDGKCRDFMWIGKGNIHWRIHEVMIDVFGHDYQKQAEEEK